MTTIGFIGTGIMGKPMVQNLQKAGFHLALSEHRKPVDPELLTDKTVVRGTLREVAESSEFIITMVPDTPQVESVLFDTDGIFDGLSEGKIVIDMSSISPIATKEFAKRIRSKGADYLDAPVSGGDVGAKAGTLSIMVGGKPDTFNRALPLFEAMGKNITLVGNTGDGQTCKVANQIIVALNIQAVSEALLFASKMGADPARVREALMGGFASSKILEVHAERMLKGAFEPGFRVELHQKDLNLALSAAREKHVTLPNTSTTQELFNACAAMGGSQWDHSALIKVLEHLSDHSIRK